MSLQSLLSKIWNEIKQLFASIPADLKTAVHVGVLVTENMKKFIDSPAADILTALIPGDIDDKVKYALRDKLPLILSELRLAHECKDINDPIQLTNCAVRTLQSMDDSIKSSFLHTISILITEVVSDGKLSWSDGVYLSEWYYQHKYKAGN
jgi:hypothetical protein